MKFLKNLFNILKREMTTDWASKLNFTDSNRLNFYHYEDLESPKGLRFICGRLISIAHPCICGRVRIPIDITSIEGHTVTFRYGGKTSSYITCCGDNVYVQLSDSHKRQIYKMLVDEGHKVVQISPLKIPYRGSIVLNDMFGYKFELNTEGAVLKLSTPHRDPC